MRWVDRKEASVGDLIGKTLMSVTQGHGSDGNTITFVTDAGAKYVMYHESDCCESVDIEDICGDLADLVGSPITLAEESSNSEDTPRGLEGVTNYTPDSYTWTYYTFATIKGYVDIRWYGESNGYYSERVDFVQDLRGAETE